MAYSVGFRRKALAVKEQENLTFEEAGTRFGADNAAFRKRADIRQATKGAGHGPEFPSPCSPGPDPVEHKRAQAKADRRRGGCPIETLFSDGSL